MTDVAGILRAWGRNASPEQLDQLDRYSMWLVEEAIPAGGLGSAEGGRIGERHILDSLAFLNALPADPPASLIDLGSGVGLPGIPLAIMLPDTEVTLLDRSSRRVQLARRAVRVLGLGNVRTEAGPIASRRVEVLTMRAVMEPAQAIRVVSTMFPNSHAVIAITRGDRPTALDQLRVESHHLRVVDGGVGMLDLTPWLLIMAPS